MSSPPRPRGGSTRCHRRVGAECEERNSIRGLPERSGGIGILIRGLKFRWGGNASGNPRIEISMGYHRSGNAGIAGGMAAGRNFNAGIEFRWKARPTGCATSAIEPYVSPYVEARCVLCAVPPPRRPAAPPPRAAGSTLRSTARRRVTRCEARRTAGLAVRRPSPVARRLNAAGGGDRALRSRSTDRRRRTPRAYTSTLRPPTARAPPATAIVGGARASPRFSVPRTSAASVSASTTTCACAVCTACARSVHPRRAQASSNAAATTARCSPSKRMGGHRSFAADHAARPRCGGRRTGSPRCTHPRSSPGSHVP